MTKTCINATNLHHGGGVQVASSFILDLLDSGVEECDYDLYVSDIVCQNLPEKFRGSSNDQEFSKRCEMRFTWFC